MPMEKKILTDAEKELKKKEQDFNKSINKIWKLRPYKINGISDNVGRAPKCNSSTAKKEVSITVSTKKKK